MPVIDVRVGDDMHQLACLKSRDLCEHVGERRILADVPVVRRKHVLAALVQNGVQRVPGDVEGHGVGTGVERHLVQVLKVVDAGQDAP